LSSSSALKYAIRKVQENNYGLEINGTPSFLVPTDDVNSVGENINISNKSTEALLAAGKEDGLEINAEEMKYVFFSHHQMTGQNHYISK
jgi:hypothetical protein